MSNGCIRRTYDQIRQYCNCYTLDWERLKAGIKVSNRRGAKAVLCGAYAGEYHQFAWVDRDNPPFVLGSKLMATSGKVYCGEFAPHSDGREHIFYRFVGSMPDSIFFLKLKTAFPGSVKSDQGVTLAEGSPLVLCYGENFDGNRNTEREWLIQLRSGDAIRARFGNKSQKLIRVMRNTLEISPLT